MEKRKKICVVGPSKLFLSGVSIYTIRIANALCRTNEVCLLYIRKLMPRCLYPGKAHIGKSLTKLRPAHSINIYEVIDYNSLLGWIRVYKFLKREKPQVILMPWWTLAAAHLLLFIKLLNKLFIKAKVVLELHESTHPFEEKSRPLKFFSKLSLAILLKGLDGYVVHSHQDKRFLTDIMGREESRIVVIPHALYDHYGAPLDKKQTKEELKIKEDFLIFFFGLILENKGVSLIIQAFNQLPAEIIRRSRFLILGELWNRKVGIDKCIKESPYPKKITAILRHPSDDEILRYFSCIDVVVLPYNNVHKSGVRTMAMSFGKPIILSKNGAGDDSLLEYEGNFFVEHGNAQQITDKIHEIFSSSRKLYRAPALGFNKIAARFDDFLGELLEKDN